MPQHASKTDRLSKKARGIWEGLSDQDRAVLRGYPLKFERDAMICALYDRNVAPKVLQELTGLSSAQIYRIIEKWRDPLVRHLRRQLAAIEELNMTLGRIASALENIPTSKMAL
jgi:predicted DNA-binding transcriptional regulator AlpA